MSGHHAAGIQGSGACRSVPNASLDRRAIVIRYLIGMLVAAALSGCQAESFTEKLTPRSPLLNGFESYAARSEVLPKLPRGMAPQVIEDSSLLKGDQRPPFSIYTIRVAVFAHLGQVGALQLTFFNDRLEQTTFYPADPNAYVAALKAHNLNIIDGRQTKINNTVVWSAVDYRGQRYVAWADQRLQDQSNRWIARFS